MVGIFTKSSKSLAALQKGVAGVVSIEGNVGAGKSSLMRAIGAKGFFVNEEPVDQWAAYLPMFLADRHRYTLAFQLQCMNRFCVTGELFEELTSAKETSKVKFVERSANAALLFAKHGVQNGELSEWEYGLLEQRMKMCFKPEFTVYLQTTPEIAFERKNLRNRVGEENSQQAYLESMHELHETEFNNGSDSNTLVLPALSHPEDLADQVVEWMNEKEAEKTEQAPMCHITPKPWKEENIFSHRQYMQPLSLSLAHQQQYKQATA